MGGFRGLSKTCAAAATGAVAAVVGFAVLRLTAPCVYLCFKSWRGGDPNATLRQVTLIEIPTALRMGLGCAFVVIVGATVWSETRRDPLAFGAGAGMTWILVNGFVQELLYNLNFNVFTDAGDAFWAFSYLGATALVVGYVARKIAAGAIGDPHARPVE